MPGRKNDEKILVITHKVNGTKLPLDTIKLLFNTLEDFYPLLITEDEPCEDLTKITICNSFMSRCSPTCTENKKNFMKMF